MITYNFNPEKVCSWICEKAGGKYTEICTGIGIEHNGNLIAAAMYHDFTGANGSILMGWRVENRKYITAKFYAMAFDYPFNQLKVQRINSLVKKSNIHALELNKKIGFNQEFIIERYFPNDDCVLSSMYKENCRFLRKNYADKLHSQSKKLE